MARSSPSDKIAQGAKPFQAQIPTRYSPANKADGTGPTAPGDGKPELPKPVRLTHPELTALAEEFSTEIEYQYESDINLRNGIQDCLTVYDGKPKDTSKDYPLAHASNVVVKVAQIYTDQVVARIMQSIFDPQPHWVMQELNKKFAAAVKPYERYMDWARQNTWNQRHVILPFVQDVVKLGTGILYNDFVNEPVFRYDDAARKTFQTGTRKGPKPTWIPREDYLIPEGFIDSQVAPYVAPRFWWSWDRLERLQYQNFIENLDRLKGQDDDEDDIRQLRRNDRPMVTAQHDDRFGLWAPRWVWFRRDLDKDGWPEEYVMLLHTRTRTILRLTSNPSPSGMRPFCVGKYQNIEGMFDGIGIPENVELLQEELSTIHNQRRDAAHLANIVMWKARLTSNLTDTVRPTSGKVIKLADINDLEQLHINNPAAIDIAEEEAVMRLVSLQVGMNDVDMGKASSPVGRAAATTIMALMQEGTRRFDLNVSAIRDAITEMGHQITELWQIYGLPDPQDPASPENILDEEDAAAVRALLEQPIPLRGLVSIKMNVATAAINKEVEKQSNMQLYQTTSQYLMQMLQLAPVLANPTVPPELKAATIHCIQGQDQLLKQIFQSFNKFDLESVLAGELFEQMAEKSIQMQQQMQAMGMNPQAAGPGPAQGNGAGPPEGGRPGELQPPAKPPRQPTATPPAPPWANQ